MTRQEMNGMTRQNMETLRMQAADLLATGMSQAKTARSLGVTRTTTSRWARKLRTFGTAGLQLHRAPGRPSRLTSKQRFQFVELWKSREKWKSIEGFSAELAKLGIFYDPDHVCRLVHQFELRPKRVKKEKEAHA